ncbi:MAG: pilin [Betaproteobacteria bacterium]|nr:pilin [Betaproteobacteria bacterium]
MTPNSSGDMPDESTVARRGFGWWLKRIVVAIVLIAMASFFLIPAYHGFRPRALISEALTDGAELKFKVAEFYESHRRLPLDAEVRALQTLPSELKRAQSVVWDPAGRRVVVTAGDPQPGKRFALNAEERDGKLDWTCRTIDLDPKYLPGTCR